MGRSVSLKKDRGVDPRLAEEFRLDLDDNRPIGEIINELALQVETAWRRWERLTDIRNRLKGASALSEEDERFLLRTFTLRELPPGVERSLEKGDPSPIIRFMSGLARPEPDCTWSINEEFSLQIEETANSIAEVALHCPKAANSLLKGRLRTAELQWLEESGKEASIDRSLFYSLLPFILRLHLIDSLWLAGADTRWKNRAPTGSVLIDGPDDTSNPPEIKLGGMMQRLKRMETAFAVLDGIAKLKTEEERLEALTASFGGILPAIYRHGQRLEEEFGRSELLKRLTARNHEGRALAKDAIAEIEKKIAKTYSPASGTPTPKTGLRTLRSYIGRVDHTLYLSFACAFWWLQDPAPKADDAGNDDNETEDHEAGPIDDIDIADIPRPKPMSFSKRQRWEILYLIIRSYSLDNVRHKRRKFLEDFDDVRELRAPSDMRKAIEKIIDCSNKQLDAAVGRQNAIYVSEASRKALEFWDRWTCPPNGERSREGHSLETECFGRFWLRLQL